MKLKSLDYVVLIVNDIDESQRFYTETLGLPLKHRRGSYAQIESGETRLGLFSQAAMVSIIGDAAESTHTTVGAKFELGFKVDDCDSVFAELVKDEVPVIAPPQTRSWGQRTAYLADPDGNLIELVEDMSDGIKSCCPE